MRRSPSIVPNADDREIYLVLDDFGERLGRAWRETDDELTDRETLIADLIAGQYKDPVRVAAFNTAEGWSRDVSEDIADELEERLATEQFEVPAGLQNFIDSHGSGRPIQLALPLRDAA
jgi:hypothetical protein